MIALTSAACGPAIPGKDSPGAAQGFPGGRLLLVTGHSALLYSSTEAKRSLGGVHPFDLSQDGSAILAGRFEREPTGFIRTTDLIAVDWTSEVEQVVVHAEDEETLFPAQWSPDGSRTAYRVTTYDEDPSETHPLDKGLNSLCVRTLALSSSRCFDLPVGVNFFDWSPDGSSLLVAGPGTQPVMRLDVETGATDPLISPGGDQALRRELERLGYGRPQQFVLPQWSPSGRYIAALVSLRGGNRAYVPAILTSGGKFVSLAKASGEFPDAFAWAPDRDVLAYTAGEAPYAITELYVHDPAGATDRFLSTTESEGPMIPRIDGLAWSPDGRWIAFSRPNGIRVVDAQGEEPARELDVRGTLLDWAPEQRLSTADPSPSPVESPIPEPSTTESTDYVGFHPESRVENGEIVMPLVFVDGSSAEVVALSELGIQRMTAAMYTAGGLGGVDRTMNFRYGSPGSLFHEGPLETYEGYDGEPVEVWKGPPGDWECPNLVFHFGDWFVGVRTCQRELSVHDKEMWAGSLRGEVKRGGFLVLSADPPLVLQQTGGHEGPELILGMDRANWIELEPGRCDPSDLPDEGDIRTMKDGTRVSFSRIGGGDSGIAFNWFATWCEDGLMRVQVSYAYEGFAVEAAEGFRLREIVLAE